MTNDPKPHELGAPFVEHHLAAVRVNGKAE
jgi:hypothetical protein